jgi:hypothetical protein
MGSLDTVLALQCNSDAMELAAETGPDPMRDVRLAAWAELRRSLAVLWA